MDSEVRCLELRRALRVATDDPAAWRPGPARTAWVREPKGRLITIVPFADRVVHHALVAPAESAFERFAIHDSYACRPGKGAVAALRRAERFARSTAWAWRGDVRRYFASIPHDSLLELLRSRLPDRDLCDRFELVVRAGAPGTGSGRGLPVGSLTSQHLANLYLGVLDHAVKDELGVRRYLRYMDDFVVFGERSQLKALARRIGGVLHRRLGLALNPRASGLVPVGCGVPFLGWLVTARGLRPQRRTVARARAAVRALDRGLADGSIGEEDAAAAAGSRLALWEALDPGALRARLRLERPSGLVAGQRSERALEYQLASMKR